MKKDVFVICFSSFLFAFCFIFLVPGCESDDSTYVSFRKPAVQSIRVFDITPPELGYAWRATFEGRISDTGAGMCWWYNCGPIVGVVRNTSPNPTYPDDFDNPSSAYYFTYGSTISEGPYEVIMPDLHSETTHYVRAFIKFRQNEDDDWEYRYGSQVSFRTE